VNGNQTLTVAPEPTPEPTPEATPEASEEIARELVGRFGSFFLTVDREDKRDKGEVLNALVEALQGDSRVLPFTAPEPSPEWDRYVGFYPGKPPPEPEALLTVTDRRRGLIFSDRIAFVINVQKKNQPQFRDYEEIPAETYYVMWNGVACMVLWVQPSGERITPGGGHIAKQVMKAAANAVGAEVYFQGCEPACELEFAHTPLRVRSSPEIDNPKFELEGDWRPTATILVPSDGTEPPNELAVIAFAAARASIERFSLLKNMAQRLEFIEGLVAADLPHLLSHQYEMSEARQESWWRHPIGRLKQSWGFRAWRKEARWLMDRLWLSVAHLEAIRRAWEQERVRFDDTTARFGNAMLFNADFLMDASSIETLRLDTVQLALKEMGGRLSSGAIVRWTALLAGAAVLAAVVTVLLDRLLGP
jgi:hypothetical protein